MSKKIKAEWNYVRCVLFFYDVSEKKKVLKIFKFTYLLEEEKSK